MTDCRSNEWFRPQNGRFHVKSKELQVYRKFQGQLPSADLHQSQVQPEQSATADTVRAHSPRVSRPESVTDIKGSEEARDISANIWSLILERLFAPHPANRHILVIRGN